MSDEFTILLDCDGPLADFTGAYIKALNELTGESFEKSDVTQWNMLESLGFKGSRLKELKAAMHDVVCSPGFCLGMEPQPWAQSLFYGLELSGDVVIVTSPWSGSRHWPGERQLWLQEHFGIGPKDIIFAHKKYMVRGDCLIDDKPDHVHKWSEAFPDRESILFPLGNNSGVRLPETSTQCLGVRRASTPMDVVGIVAQMKLEDVVRGG